MTQFEEETGNRCFALGDLLSAYVDGEVTASERARVEEHLHSCKSCRRNYVQIGAVSALVARAATDDAPAESYWTGMNRRIMSRISALPRFTPIATRILKWRVPAYTSLAVAATILVALFLSKNQPSQQPVGQPPALAAVAPSGKDDTPQIAAAAQEEVEERRRSVRASVSEPAIARDGAGGAPQPVEIAWAADAQPAPTSAQFEQLREKPARGGIELLQSVATANLKAQGVLRGATTRSEDPVVTDLRAMELSLRRRLENAADTSEAAKVRPDLAETLFNIANHTAQPADVTDALDFWRPNYDALAASFGDSLAATRLRRLEALVQSNSKRDSSE
jgi:hypothetical protein